ncbi:MAG: DUF748 domain-containing protein, partial [Leptolyngbyaceae bacterium]|nr:DUF748 domain-containing protein [Leptolyngbyaceae bacterium]
MTSSPPPGNQFSSLQHRLRRLLLSRTSLVAGIFLMAGVGWGTWRSWVFVQNELSPLVEKNLSQTLQRPVKLGRVEQFSYNGLRFGTSSLPSTPTQRDRLSADAIAVNFDPLRLLLTRQLDLDISLVKPDVYVEQSTAGTWEIPKIAAQEQAGLINTEIKTVQILNGQVVLLPVAEGRAPRVPVKLSQINGTGRFLGNPRDQDQRIVLDVGATFSNAGTVKIQGEVRTATTSANLHIRGQNLPAATISRLLPIPIALQSGQLNSNLTVGYQPKQPLNLGGVVEVKGVTAQIANLPKLLVKTQGRLRFREQQVSLENLSTLYGRLPLQVLGSLDLQKGYNLSVRTQPTNVQNFLDTIALPPPVPIKGILQVNLQIKGAITKPVVSGNLVAPRPVQIDRVGFKTLRAQFQLANSVLSVQDLQAVPTAGGVITGQGRIQLGRQPQVGLTAEARGIPGDSIAQLYGNTSGIIKLGAITAQVQVSGAANNLQTVVQWQAPQATYPGTGEVVIAGQTLRLRDTVLKVGGGTVTAQGEIAQKRWQVNGVGSQIKLAQVSPNLQGVLNGDFKLAGSTSAFKLDAVQGTGQGRLAIAGGTVDLTGKVQSGRWQAVAKADQVELKRFSPNLSGLLSSDLTASGTTDALKLSAIQAAGQVKFSQGLSLIKAPLTAQVQWD